MMFIIVLSPTWLIARSISSIHALVDMSELPSEKEVCFRMLFVIVSIPCLRSLISYVSLRSLATRNMRSVSRMKGCPFSVINDRHVEN